MIGEKKLYWEKYNPIKKWIYFNKSILHQSAKRSFLVGYGERTSKWEYHPNTREFSFRAWRQVDKHEWSKNYESKKIHIEKLIDPKHDTEFTRRLYNAEKKYREQETA